MVSLWAGADIETDPKAIFVFIVLSPPESQAGAR
jgi:hypothetical protein